MKYVRKTVVIVLLVVFLIALAISAAVATTIKNVNVTYTEGTGEGREAYDATLENLLDLKGGNIFLLSDEEVYSCVADGSRLDMVSVKKVYPCTLEIVISERIETFYNYSDGVCYVYDEDGVLMYSTDEYEETADGGYVISGTADSSPDVYIQSDSQAERDFIAESCAVFKSYFGSLRGLVNSVYREITPDGENLIFVLRSGLEIEISGCDGGLEEKIASAYERYLTLSDGQKTGGQIRAYDQANADGSVKSDYIP